MRLANKLIDKIYKYIYIHSGQTILIKDIAAATGITRQTVSKYIRWLQRREIIKKTGKLFEVVPV